MPAEEAAPAEPALAELSEGGNEPDPGGFQESQNAFQDIVAFGEGLEEKETPAAGEDAPGEKPAVGQTSPPTKASHAPPALSQVAAAPTGILATASAGAIVLGTTGGLPISHWIDVVSASCEISQDSSAPFRTAFEVLKAHAKVHQADAIVQVTWKLSPSGKHVFVTGNAVRLEKNT